MLASRAEAISAWQTMKSSCLAIRSLKLVTVASSCAKRSDMRGMVSRRTLSFAASLSLFASCSKLSASLLDGVTSTQPIGSAVANSAAALIAAVLTATFLASSNAFIYDLTAKIFLIHSRSEIK